MSLNVLHKHPLCWDRDLKLQEGVVLRESAQQEANELQKAVRILNTFHPRRNKQNYKKQGAVETPSTYITERQKKMV